MLRGIFFLDCDYCKETYPRLHSILDMDTEDSCCVGRELEEQALEDGWCLCLDEATNTYRLMCGCCIHEIAEEAELAVMDTDEKIPF